MFTKNELQIILDYCYHTTKQSGELINIYGDINKCTYFISQILSNFNICLKTCDGFCLLFDKEKQNDEDRKILISNSRLLYCKNSINIRHLKDIIKYFSPKKNILTHFTYDDISINVVNELFNNKKYIAYYFYNLSSKYHFFNVISDNHNSMFFSLCHEFGHYLVKKYPIILKKYNLKINVNFYNRWGWENDKKKKEEEFCEFLGLYVINKLNLETNNIKIVNIINKLTPDWKSKIVYFDMLLNKYKLITDVRNFATYTASQFDLEYKSTFLEKVKNFFDKLIKV